MTVEDFTVGGHDTGRGSITRQFAAERKAATGRADFTLDELDAYVTDKLGVG